MRKKIWKQIVHCLYEYSIEEFQFKKIIENKLSSSIEMLHKKYNFDNSLCVFTGGKCSLNKKTKQINIFDFNENLYSTLLNDSLFVKNWNNFCNYVKKIVFNNAQIYIQKTPSIRIFPSGSKLQYIKKTSKIFEKENNWHIDNQEPFWHPEFEKNMWMSLIKTDHLNALYIEDDGNIFPILSENNQLLLFDSIHHGAFVHNESKNTRISIDFKVVPVDDYDENKLSNKRIIKRGKSFKQIEWYSEKYYYKKI